MAKVNLKQTILGVDGKVLNGSKEAFVIVKDPSGKEEFLKNAQGEEVIITKETPNEALTVKKQLTQVLLGHSQTLQAADKAERFALFFRMEQCEKEEIDLSAEEISLCKKCLNEHASILVAGRVSMILDPKTKGK